MTNAFFIVPRSWIPEKNKIRTSITWGQFREARVWQNRRFYVLLGTDYVSGCSAFLAIRRRKSWRVAFSSEEKPWSKLSSSSLDTRSSSVHIALPSSVRLKRLILLSYGSGLLVTYPWSWSCLIALAVVALSMVSISLSSFWLMPSCLERTLRKKNWPRPMCSFPSLLFMKTYESLEMQDTKRPKLSWLFWSEDTFRNLLGVNAGTSQRPDLPEVEDERD